MHRRDLLALTTLGALGGGLVFASGLAACANRSPGLTNAGASADADFCFAQLSDVHWGYQGPANPDASVTLRKAVAAVNALDTPPEFIVFTGDPMERRCRLAEFKSIVGALKVAGVHLPPGEHDASLDRNAAYKECFGDALRRPVSTATSAKTARASIRAGCSPTSTPRWLPATTRDATRLAGSSTNAKPWSRRTRPQRPSTMR